MVNKLAMFKARAIKHGQRITVYPFVANPSGSYVDGDSGYPDPEDGAYPDTVPEATYGTAVEVIGFVQSPSEGPAGEAYMRTVHGEQFPIDLIAYLPGDTALTVRDRIIIDNVAYDVLRIEEQKDASTVVIKKCFLRTRIQ